MTLEQLRIFVAVAERQHVTQAARDINITQSAASAAIAALEARYAIKLFDRVGRRIELTSTGRIFLNEARAVLARSAAAERTLDDLAGLRRGSLALHASQTVANYWLPAHMMEFRRRHPHITLRLTLGNTEQVAEATRAGAADLGFVEGAVDDPQLSVREVGRDKLIIVAGAGHAFAGKRRLRLADLDVVLELPSNEAIRAAVEAGGCATAISELVAETGLAAGRLVSPSFPLPSRAFLVLHHKERYVREAEKAFLELIGVGEARR